MSTEVVMPRTGGTVGEGAADVGREAVGDLGAEVPAGAAPAVLR